MAEYIEREAVLDYIDHMPSELTSDGRRMIRRIRLTEYIADSIPAADVVPVRHGRWIVEDFTELVKCSECDNDAPLDTTGGGQWRSPFCPLCGAKMDGDGDV